MTHPSSRSQPERRCPDEVLMRRFLDEQLTDVEESRVVQHIEDCLACCRQLEKLSGGKRGWQSLVVDLADSLDSSVTNDTTGSTDTSELRRESEALATASEDALALLGPTDDPTKLGKLGPYEVVGLVGTGSTGIVFKAFDASLHRFVAIKMLAPGYSGQGAARARFEREGRAVASVCDEHVIAIYGVDEFGSVPAIVMRYMPGGSLQQRLDAQGPMTTEEVVRLGMQIASGLAAAHRQGIIHRDVKPANVLLERGVERAIVTDFGLARVADEAAVTHSGLIAGTPQFMSPEQARGESLDERTDLFSLGAVLYALCTGHSPFRSETLLGVMHRVCETEARPIREIRPEVEPWLAEFIVKLLAKRREERFDSAGEVAELLAGELAALQSPTMFAEPERAWRVRAASPLRQALCSRRGVLAAVVLLAVLLGGVWYATGTQRGNQSSGGRTNRAAQDRSSLDSLSSARASFEAAEGVYQAFVFPGKARHQPRDPGSTELDYQIAFRAHRDAMEQGYDPSTSAYRLACLQAMRGEADDAFAWLDAATEAGFGDFAQLREATEFESLREDPRFASALESLRSTETLRAKGRRHYFSEGNYAEAEQVLRCVLQAAPKDDYTALLIGSSLLLQGKRAESAPWHERAKKSVRYASFGHYNAACVAARNADAETALEELRLAIDGGFADPDHIRKDPDLEFLRAYPQFSELVLYAADRSVAK